MVLIDNTICSINIKSNTFLFSAFRLKKNEIGKRLYISFDGFDNFNYDTLEEDSIFFKTSFFDATTFNSFMNVVKYIFEDYDYYILSFNNSAKHFSAEFNGVEWKLTNMNYNEYKEILNDYAI